MFLLRQCLHDVAMSVYVLQFAQGQRQTNKTSDTTGKMHRLVARGSASIAAESQIERVHHQTRNLKAVK